MDLLIVDDEAVIREGIKRTLQNRFPEHRIHLASGPQQAMDMLKEQPVHVVLTDIMMPGRTGLELMAACRPLYPKVKWVVISAYSEFSYAQEAVRLGAKDYLLKPLGKEALIEMVDRIGTEIAAEEAESQEAQQLKRNLRFLRETVFHRWVAGLDTGSFDMSSMAAAYPEFHLIFVKVENEHAAQLEQTGAEQVLRDLIGKCGSGFVTPYTGSSLLGLVSFREGCTIHDLSKQLGQQLKFPFQLLHSDILNDFERIPEEAERLRQASATPPPSQPDGSSDKAVEVALQYINAHYREKLSLELVAAVVFLNPVYFSQLFKTKTGQGFKEYVIRLRMEEAKRLLRDPKLKLAIISEMVGYQDMRHFTQVFRKTCGMTPSQYREAPYAASGILHISEDEEGME